MQEQLKVQLPGNAYAAAGDDLSAPIRQLLKDLELLETRTRPDGELTKEVKATLLGGTPPSLQVLSAGALSMSKWMITLVTTLGGSGAVTFTALWADAAGPLRIAYVAAAAACVVAAAIAIAIIVSSDASARSRGTVAEYHARAAVAAALVDSLQYGKPTPPSPPPPSGYHVKKASCNGTTPEWLPVERFEHRRGQGLVAVVKGQALTGDQIADWFPEAKQPSKSSA